MQSHKTSRAPAAAPPPPPGRAPAPAPALTPPAPEVDRPTGPSLEWAAGASAALAPALTGTPALRLGARGPRVEALQRALGDAGHPVAVDGAFGPQTLAAVRAVQRARGLQVDGVVGPATAGALRGGAKGGAPGDGPAWAARLPLSAGARGEGVRGLQAALRALGASLEIDGAFGPATARAVRAFQAANGLEPDGVVGRATAARLRDPAAERLDRAPEDLPGEYLGPYEAWRGGKSIGTVHVVELDGVKVAERTARAWVTLKSAAARDGVRLKLNSGFRTMEEQRYFWDRYQNRGGAPAAYPGHSSHQHGQALDIDMVDPAAARWMVERAPAMGWKQTDRRESWHWEYFGP